MWREREKACSFFVPKLYIVLDRSSTQHTRTHHTASYRHLPLATRDQRRGEPAWSSELGGRAGRQSWTELELGAGAVLSPGDTGGKGRDFWLSKQPQQTK
jgi:hypothetical protein